MDSTKQDDRHLYIAWKERFCHRVFRVDGNIDFEDGKAIFKLRDGTTVRIQIEQITTIGISGNIDVDKYRTKEKQEQQSINNITPLFPDK